MHANDNEKDALEADFEFHRLNDARIARFIEQLQTASTRSERVALCENMALWLVSQRKSVQAWLTTEYLAGLAEALHL